MLFCIESDPVSELSAIRVSDTQLTVRWTPPYRPNGVITNYSIEIYEVSTDCGNRMGMRTPVQTNDDTTSQVLEDLGKLQCVSKRWIEIVDHSDQFELF